ncbi:hypothetical protein BCR39DRAFT_590304 [Naematelia encephala]|uniref:Uncharacterized protein n=1 Tax=Naematelia encephala TaxID=71784 RepID=A0A1Y2ARN7_9TREE|nr:hypothetical protein BCR39DRAFT_590304 [Naematelia encephala]
MTTANAAPPALRVNTSLELPRIGLERAESQPSLSHSASTTVSEEPTPSLGSLLSPLDSDSSRDSQAGKKTLNKFRSMTNLRNKDKKDVKAGKDFGSFVKSAKSPSASSASTAAPVRPVPRRSGSSFSSFIRKLTGRAASPPRSKPQNQTSTLRAPEKPLLAQINTQVAHAPQVYSAPISHNAPNPNPNFAQMPQSASGRISTYVPPSPRRETDPLYIPLPPSPTLSPVDSTTTLAPPLAVNSVRRTKPTGMLSLEGFDLEEEDDDGEDEEVEENLRSVEGESDHKVRQHTLVGVPSGGGGSPARASDGGILLTPTSDSEITGRSPTSQANLLRKESRFRKSMMGLSDHVGIRPVPRMPMPPPTSHEAYEAQQRRAAANRRSCAPTMHSAASVMRELTEIKDKSEADVAETFFLS